MVWNKTGPKMKEIKEGPEEEEPAEGGDVPPEDKKEDDAQSQGKVSAEEDNNISRGEEADAAAEGDHEQMDDDMPKEPLKPKKYIHLPYLEDDYKMRVSGPDYEEIKRIEDEILEFKKENVKTYVLASGIMYGMGENIFESHFKKAWLQNP